MFCSDVSYMTSYLPGGNFQRGVSENSVTTVLGNLNLQELCNGFSKFQVDQEKLQYFTCQQITKKSLWEIFPDMIVSSKENEKTENGQWQVLEASHILGHRVQLYVNRDRNAQTIAEERVFASWRFWSSTLSPSTAGASAKASCSTLGNC